jgi:hypothetical protein
VAQLFGLPFEFCTEPFLPLGVSEGPEGLVIFDLFFDHSVKDHCDLVGGCQGGSFGNYATAVVTLRTANDSITRVAPLMIMLTPTRTPIAQAELIGHCM